MIYVLQVMTGKELDILSELKKLPCHPMVPRQILTERKGGQVTQRENILFAGYVFIDTKLDLSAYYKIKAIPNVIHFLGGGDPATLPDSEAKYIMWLNNGDKTLDPSEIGADGKVISGPLMGYEKNITAVNKRQQRVKVNINIMGEPNEISLAATVAGSPSDNTPTSDPKEDGTGQGAAAEVTAPNKMAEGIAETK